MAHQNVAKALVVSNWSPLSQDGRGELDIPPGFPFCVVDWTGNSRRSQFHACTIWLVTPATTLYRLWTLEETLIHSFDDNSMYTQFFRRRYDSQCFSSLFELLGIVEYKPSNITCLPHYVSMSDQDE